MPGEINTAPPASPRRNDRLLIMGVSLHQKDLRNQWRGRC
jgi:hypothetical protein